MAAGSEVMKAVESLPGLDQTKHRKSLDDVRREFAQSSELIYLIGLGVAHTSRKEIT